MRDIRYKISVVIPIYNTEIYLRETLDSVINQSIGIDNIQLILVNDGSTDSSGDICKEYSKMYPDNIVYVEKENGGASSARNVGFEYVQGKYVNFLDSDDKWERDGLERLYAYFEAHYEEVNLVAGRLCYFGRVTGFTHKLDFRFKETAIIDVEEKPQYIHLHLSTALIKTISIQKRPFNESLKYSEDILFETFQIVPKGAYGVVKEAVLLYRKREERTSAMDSYLDVPEAYCPVIEKSYNKLAELKESSTDNMSKYVQYMLLGDMRFRLVRPVADCIDEDERERYICELKEYVKNIDDDVLFRHKFISEHAVIKALSIKYDRDIVEESQLKGSKLYYGDKRIFNFRGRKSFLIKNVFIRNDKLVVKGIHSLDYMRRNYKVVAETERGERIDVKVKWNEEMTVRSFEGEIILKKYDFTCEIPLESGKSVRFYIEADGIKRFRLWPGNSSTSPLNRSDEDCFYIHKSWAVRMKDYALEISKISSKEAKSLEKKYIEKFVDLEGSKVVEYRKEALAAKFKGRIGIKKTRIEIYGMERYAMVNGKRLSFDSKEYERALFRADQIAIVNGKFPRVFGEHEKYLKNLYDFEIIDIDK